MKKTISIIVLVIFVVGVIYIVSQNDPNAVMPAKPGYGTPPPIATSTKTYSVVDVSKHATRSSCWTIINAKVYDLTDWIAKHPGGEDAILSICGKDGSTAFNDQHGGMQKQADILATFIIGVSPNTIK